MDPYVAKGVRRPSLPAAAVLVVLLVLFVYNAVQYLTFVLVTPDQVDFSDFYWAVHTGLMHGWAHMYDPAIALPELLAKTGTWVQFVNPPLFAFLLLPIAVLPYPLALGIWDGLMLLCFVACWWLLVGRWGQRLAALTLLPAGFALYPVMLGLAFGQPTMLVLLAVVAACLLLGRGRPYLAGALLASLLIKPQAAFLVPLALVFSGRWRSIAGWLAALIPLAAASFLAVGPQGVALWRESVLLAYQMPDHRYSSPLWILGPGLLPVLIAIWAAATAAFIAWKGRSSPEMVLAGGLSASVLATPYLSVHDLSALLIAAWMILRLEPPRWLLGLMLAGYLPFFFANALFDHLPFLVVECLWLGSLLVFCLHRFPERRSQAGPLHLEPKAA